MDLKKIFEEKIKIEPKVMAIETIFNNPKRLKKTNFSPAYQRKYVWDIEKATYFIESIILGTEIPPLIFFNNISGIEVIDGRQRYETILKFIKNEFKLRKSGLHKFSSLANKNFESLGHLRDVFWDTKLRIIEFGFHSPKLVDEKIEGLVKNEIFKRYNSGITPLKTTEVDKAIFLNTDLNSLFKEKIKNDQIIFDEIWELFKFDRKNEEILFKKIRELLVLHKIPINKYAIKKQLLVNKFFEYLSEEASDEQQIEIYESFISRINILKRVLNIFKERGFDYNRLISECIYWAIQIFEIEGKNPDILDDKVLNSLAVYINENKDAYKLDRSSFAKILLNRYVKTSEFFHKNFGVDYTVYIQTSDTFKKQEKVIDANRKDTETVSGVESLRINKPEPSSITIEDIVRQMERNRFLIRPSYQRDEVINRKKSSAIIESILLGIKIPPIFIYKRKDGISEVIDGQQRLLSILGYIQKGYLNESNTTVKSKKDGYSLSLKEGILKDLHGSKFKNLPSSMQDRILEFDLWKIDIEEKSNPDFDQIDLFVRLNYKPYPIKENTFEMWNSYIDREIIEQVKKISNTYEDWFYLRKENTRMGNENICTALSYLQFKLRECEISLDKIQEYLDIYKIGNRINFRIKSKNEITKTLEDTQRKPEFLQSCKSFEKNFIQKVKFLSQPEAFSKTHEENLNSILNVKRRTQQSFYALWVFLFDISQEVMEKKYLQIRDDLRHLFIAMKESESKDIFLAKVVQLWEKYKA